MNNIYKINNKKFKGILISINYTLPVTKEQLSKTAVLASILGKSSKKFENQTKIQNYLYKLYGAIFDVNVQKIGDLYSVEFRIEFVNKKYLPKIKDVSKECIDFLYEIIYNPNIENGKFKEEVLEREKASILEKIMARKDNKYSYAVLRTEELLCQNEVAGMYLFGDEEIVPKLTSKDVYEQYVNMINHSCINVIISGNLEGYDNIDDEIMETFKEKLENKFNIDDILVNTNNNEIQKIKIRETSEIQQTNQSVITYGLRVMKPKLEDYYALNIYNAILGLTPSSKLFRNFREKKSLAYVVMSRCYRFKNIIIIYAGIEKENYEKAKLVVNEELEDIKNGKVTMEEFEAAKESILSNLLEWEDSKLAISKMLFSNLFAYKKDDITLEKMYEKMKNVTLQDVIDVAQKVKLEEIYLLGGATNV